MTVNINIVRFKNGLLKIFLIWVSFDISNPYLGDATEENFRITHAFDDRDGHKKQEETPFSKTASSNYNDNLRIISSSENPYYGAPDDLEDDYRNRSATNASVKVTENVYYEWGIICVS